MQILDLLIHRYVRVGDTVLLSYSGNRGPVAKATVTKIEGFGKYAAVRTNDSTYGAIRRDQIRKDAFDNWFYCYDD